MSTVWTRRDWMWCGALGGAAAAPPLGVLADDDARAARRGLRIAEVTITPVALPDPPILAASGCHGPYFLRNFIQLRTEEGVVGVGETYGGEGTTLQLQTIAERIVGRSVAEFRSFPALLEDLRTSAYAGLETACLDALGRATGLKVCELLGGPVRDEVEFAAYLFFRYAADHPRVLDDPALVDGRGAGANALDDWGEVRSPEAMAAMAERFRKQWGFRVFKLKAGVLPPTVEVEALQAIEERVGRDAPLRIDPNGRWTVPTAVRMARRLRDFHLEYYEDPVQGMTAMADVRSATGLPHSTNMCVTRFEHLPRAARLEPIDIVLGDHHYWGGLTAFVALGPIAEAFGWGLSMHSNNHAGVSMAAMIHCAAATPAFAYAADTHYVWLPPDADVIAGEKLPITGGCMRVPDGPGLGVTLDPDKLARAHERYVRCGVRDRDDASTMRRFEPGWEPTLF